MKIRTSLLGCAVDFHLGQNNMTIDSVLSSEVVRGVEKGVLFLRDRNCKEIPLTHRVKDDDFINICLH